MRTPVVLLALCAGCFLIPKGTPPPPPAGPSPAGIWEIAGAGTLEITGQPERWWGVWHRPGKPPVALKSVAFDDGELSLVAMESPEPGAFLLRVQPDGRFAGRYSGEKISGRRLSSLPPDSLRDIDLEPLGPGVVSTDAGESFSALSPDGRDLYFTRHDEHFEHHTLHLVHLDGVQIASKSEVLGISGRWDDRTPFVTPDGKQLWFSSNRPAGLGDEPSPTLQLWFSERDQGRWADPRRVELGREAVSPALAANGTLYFSSRGQLFRARLLATGYEPPQALPQKGTGVYVTPDESLLLTTDGDDLFADGKRLGPPVNSFAREYGPLLSPDRRWLYFTSDRRGSGDLYRVPWRGAP